MRKVTFGVACSLDNFIARPDGGVEWLRWSNDVTALMADFWKTIDTVLIGRKTYEVARASSGGKGGGSPGISTYVFSRTLTEDPGAGTEIVAEDAAPFVRRLKSQEGKDICLMGGGLLAKSLFDAGLIDEVGLNIHPILLGDGVPLFLDMAHSIDLELLDCRPLEHGCVYASYRVKHD